MVEHEHQRLAGRNPLAAIDGARRIVESHQRLAQPTNQGREHARMIRQPRPPPGKSGGPATGDLANAACARDTLDRAEDMRSTNRRRARANFRASSSRVSRPMGGEHLAGAWRRADRRRARLVCRSGGAGRRGERSDRQAAGLGRRGRLSDSDRQDDTPAVAPEARDDRAASSRYGRSPRSAATAKSKRRPAPSWPRRLPSPSQSRCDRSPGRPAGPSRPPPAPAMLPPPPSPPIGAPPSLERSAEGTPSWRPAIALALTTDTGALPSTSIGVGLAGSLQHRSLQLALLATWFGSEDATGADHTGGTFQLAVGGARACFAPRRGRWTSLACGGFELGRLAGPARASHARRPETPSGEPCAPIWA